MNELLDNLNKQAEKALREIYSIGDPGQGEKDVPAFLRFLLVASTDENADPKPLSALDKQASQNWQEMYAFQKQDLLDALSQLARSGDLSPFPEKLDEQALEDYAANTIVMLVDAIPNDLRPEPYSLPAD